MRTLTGILLLLFSPALLAQDLNCDAGFVDFNNNVVNVDPTGIDDTENIQCALDFARDNNVPTVRLTQGGFAISELEIENFNGNLQGTSRTTTFLNIIDESIDCPAVRGSGRAHTAIRFIGGESRLRFMNITAGQPCNDGMPIDALIHFTGQPAGAECGNDVVFATVDRVDFTGPGIDNGVNAAVGSWAQGHLFDTCRNVLTGTLRVNRSTFTMLDRGVRSSMQGQSQVDINFNTFDDTFISIEMERSNQNTSVAFNKFTGESNDSRNYFAVSVNNAGNGNPAETLVALKGNTFNLSGSGFPPIGFISFMSNSNSQLNFSAVDNVFNGSGAAVGVAGFNFSNGHVGNNRFTGDGFAGIWIGNTQFGGAPEAEDWSVVGNNMDNFTSSAANIFLDTASSRVIVGPGQSMSILDSGTDNSVIN